MKIIEACYMCGKELDDDRVQYACSERCSKAKWEALCKHFHNSNYCIKCAQQKSGADEFRQ
jgi:hypothetical protein